MTTPRAKNDWRVGATIGIGIVLALNVTKLTEKILTPHIGAWAAFGVGVLVVLILTAIFGNFLHRMIFGTDPPKKPPAA